MNEPDASSWEPARLIPVAGIRNDEERERRATSALVHEHHDRAGGNGMLAVTPEIGVQSEKWPAETDRPGANVSVFS